MYKVSEAYKTAIAQQSRNFRLSGNIRMQSGDMVTLSDNNVVGEMKIETQCMSGSSSQQMLDIGAVCAAKLTMTVKNASGSDSFADACVRPVVGLEIAENSFEDIPMGIFYVDNTTVQRVKDMVTFSAYDKMIFLHFLITDTMRGNMKNMQPFTACAYVCSLVGIQMAQTSTEVDSFPNGSVLPDYSDISIETARDLIMWCAQMMGCFARINRNGKLEFVQLKAENDDKGMIIPVREIAARQRFSTTFADGVIRITRLTMKKNDGKIASATITYSNDNKRSAELELEQNPLILSLTDKTVKDCLKDILSTLKTAYFRPYQSEIANDPALDAGDYIRLRGGSIDTERGYGTGMITHNIWKYRGKHSITNVGSVPAMYQLDDESSAAEISTFSETSLLSDVSDDDGSDDINGTDTVYVQPRAQSVKRIDGLEKTVAAAGTGGVGKAVSYDTSSEIFNNYEENTAGSAERSYFCHSEGTGTTAIGFAAHAEGGHCTASGNDSHAEGWYCKATGIASHAEGQYCTASGYYSHAEGNYCTASSTGAHAGGHQCVASGMYSFAHGEGLNSGYHQTVIGRFNLLDSNMAFIIGGGSADNSRENIFAVDWEGNIYAKGMYTNFDSADTASTSAVLSAAGTGMPIKIIDHAPTADDLTGAPCVFLQCDTEKTADGEATAIYRVVDVFAEQ